MESVRMAEHVTTMTDVTGCCCIVRVHGVTQRAKKAYYIDIYIYMLVPIGQKNGHCTKNDVQSVSQSVSGWQCWTCECWNDATCSVDVIWTKCNSRVGNSRDRCTDILPDSRHLLIISTDTGYKSDTVTAPVRVFILYIAWHDKILSHSPS